MPLLSAQVSFAPLRGLLAIVSHFLLLAGSVYACSSQPQSLGHAFEPLNGVTTHPTGAPCSVVREYRGLSVDHFSSFERFFHVGQSSWDRSQSAIARGADGQPWPVLVLKVRTYCHF